MMSDRVNVDYLRDILEAVEKAADFTRGMTLEEFRKDDKTQYAVVRALEIIGEAAKKDSPKIAGKASGSAMARDGRDERQADP